MNYILKLPQSKQFSPEWQVAAEAVIMAAEDRGPLMHAHVGMMLALHGAKPIPEYDSSKKSIHYHSRGARIGVLRACGAPQELQ